MAVDDDEQNHYLLSSTAPDNGEETGADSLRKREFYSLKRTPRTVSAPRRTALVMFPLIALALVAAWMFLSYVLTPLPSLASKISQLIVSYRVSASSIPRAPKCDTPDDGYQCKPSISHYWGQYSPFFAVPSAISPDVPGECKITFAQVLSRHGARDPTASKTVAYNQTIAKIKSTVTTFKGKYAFLAGYDYTLGADQLTAFGEQEMVNSGIEFFDRYKKLAKQYTPFVRASSENRVVVSAQKFDQGYNQARTKATGADTAYPYPILILSEDAGENNT